MDHAEPQVDLEHYLQAGHVVLSGTLAVKPVHVLIPPYAQGRMKLRDIDGAEVLEALSLPMSSHSAGKTEGRFESAGKTSRGFLRVIYERPEPNVVVVITTYLESN